MEKTKHYVGLIDPPILLNSGDSLIGRHVIGESAQFGRFLFTQPPTLVRIDGSDVEIRDCVFELGSTAVLSCNDGDDA